ncbi:Thiol-disulfide oxidoreductase ResA [Botrimarina colliarenosi]|uniref:Thiol-disulfide oxidoreductase ResA n=1 Tax=Botrimarina colliarenosi TaxID=2528001 RepID=A0A5C6AIY3_9BACT|nr:redoxin domain-containing protein [Botrimarina colliarenosi]TWT99579.1 Thiol-disulfide oxidoreductase ResA [Botrimarina colliarenosi]
MARLMVLVMAGTLWMAPASTGAVTLSFPESTVGQVETQPAPEGGFGYDLYGGALYKGWSAPVPAAGEVEVPEGHVVRLKLSQAGAADLAWVDRLPADAIAVLNAYGLPLNDDDVRRLSRLTGLRGLEIGGAKVTSKGLASLRQLTALQYLQVANTAIGDEGMANLASLPQLESVLLYATQVTDKGLIALAKSKSLKAVYLGQTAITDMGVGALCERVGLKALSVLAGNPEFRGEEPCPAITDAVVEALLTQASLEHLDLSGSEITDDGLRRLSEGLPAMRRLVIDHTKVTAKGVRHVANFKALENLRCYGIEVGDESAKSMSQLKELRQLSGDIALTDAGVQSLGALLHLESIGLKDQGITDASMPVLAAMPGLKDLRLQYTAVSDEGFEKLAGLKALERIQLTGGKLTTRCVDTLATMPVLKRVGLMNIDARVDGEPTWKGIDGLCSLEEELWLCFCPALSPEDFAEFSEFTKLKQLRIESGFQSSASRPLTDEDVSHLRDLNALEYVELTSTVTTDESIEVLAQLPRLRALNLSCLATDDGLKPLASAPALERLTIASPDITDDALQRLPKLSKTLRSAQRRPFQLESAPVSRAHSGADGFWRNYDVGERDELDSLEGKPAPEIAATQWLNSGEADALEDFRGKVVLVDFWGTWCGPCIQLLPEIRRLHDEYADRGLVVIGVHSTKDADKAEEYVESNRLNWPIAVDKDEQTEKAFAVRNWPTCFLIDRQGKMRVAAIYKGDLEAAIQTLLAEKP